MTFNVTDGQGGGGGGSYTAGNGIAINSSTITNTGTLKQPAGTGTEHGVGIVLATGLPGPDGTYSGGVNIYTPVVTGLTGNVAESQGIGLSVRAIYLNTAQTYGGVAGGVFFGAGQVYDISYNCAYGGGFAGTGGTITNAGSLIAGGMTISGGNANTLGTAGSVMLNPGTSGTGGVNGVLLATGVGTIDPMVLGAFFTKSVATVGYVFVQSQG